MLLLFCVMTLASAQNFSATSCSLPKASGGTGYWCDGHPYARFVMHYDAHSHMSDNPSPLLNPRVMSLLQLIVFLWILAINAFPIFCGTISVDR